jgi:hypothetical protein
LLNENVTTHPAPQAPIKVGQGHYLTTHTTKAAAQPRNDLRQPSIWPHPPPAASQTPQQPIDVLEATVAGQQIGYVRVSTLDQNEKRQLDGWFWMF